LALEGKKKESLEALADLASQSKASIAVQSTLLNLYRDNREPVNMQQVLERMLADQPENVENRIDYANLLYKTGQTAAARTQVVTLLNGRVPTIKYYDQAIRLWAEYDAAPLPPPLLREIADKANVHSTPAVLLYFLLNGKRQIGEEILSRMSPAMRETMKPIIGRYQFADGQVAAARATASAVLEDDPLNVDGLILAGQIALLDRQAQKAINLLEQAISNDPLNPGAYMALTQAYLAKGVDWRARQVLEESLKKMPQNHDLFDFAVGLLTRLGDTNRARAVAERFTKDSSSSARAWQRLARACPPKDSFCAGFAQKGLEASRQSYLLDDPPGTPVDRGLFGRL
jgi:predicted Zn-dependent protease